jgi:hypothetical protein
MTTQTFTVDDIHRRNQGAVVVVGIQSTEGKVFPASAQVATVLRDASARELSKFLGQLANLDGRGYVVSFTSTIAMPGTAAINGQLGAAALDVTTLEMREEVKKPLSEQMLDLLSPESRERVTREIERVSIADLGLNIPGLK